MTIPRVMHPWTRWGYRVPWATDRGQPAPQRSDECDSLLDRSV